jgi:hypothetical protein
MLELGGLMLAGSVLLVSILAPIFRRASPPRWTNVSLVPELTVVAIAGLFAWGIACLAAGTSDFVQHGISVVHLALLLAIIAGGVLLRRWLIRRAGPTAPAASA